MDHHMPLASDPERPQPENPYSENQTILPNVWYLVQKFSSVRSSLQPRQVLSGPIEYGDTFVIFNRPIQKINGVYALDIFGIDTSFSVWVYLKVSEEEAEAINRVLRIKTWTA